ncbi:hypothetical protein FACS1894202_03700 [Clostridia bacterium]|nr:hypothetical protein FACS1894202_03700 [Clostridia bacterium]
MAINAENINWNYELLARAAKQFGLRDALETALDAMEELTEHLSLLLLNIDDRSEFLEALQPAPQSLARTLIALNMVNAAWTQNTTANLNVDSYIARHMHDLSRAYAEEGDQ